MSLLWRSLTTSALVASSILMSASGCKSGGGWWSPGSSKWGSTESSTSDLAVSRPPTRVPTPSSGATPATASGLASNRGAAGAQDGPYGSRTGGATSAATTAGASGYGTQPAANWQSEPHGSVAPAGGYQTGGQYNMASMQPKPQPGVTPGAYSQPYAQGATAESHVADAAGQRHSPADAGGYGQYDNSTDAAIPAENPAGSIYQDASPQNNDGSAGPAAAYGDTPSSDSPGAVSDPSALGTPLYNPASTYTGSDAANPAGNPNTSTAQPSPESISNPYSLPSTRPPTSPVPTSPTPTTSPATSTAPYEAPTLPSSLSATPGSYRPGSTAAPGSVYGTGYDTADGTLMR